jgi:virginiamycin B lyase
MPYSIASGADGNIWFTELGSATIGQMTTGGIVTEYALPNASSLPCDLALGADGALWFTDSLAGQNQIGRITTDGTIVEYPIAATGPDGTDTGPLSIVAATNGTIWFTENSAGRIANLAFIAPAITSANQATVTVATPAAVQVTTEGSPTPTLSYTGDLPLGVGFVDNGDGTGGFYGQPQNGTAGVYAGTISVHNGSGTTTQGFTLTVE